MQGNITQQKLTWLGANFFCKFLYTELRKMMTYINAIWLVIIRVLDRIYAKYRLENVLTQVDNKTLSGNNKDPLISNSEHGSWQTFDRVDWLMLYTFKEEKKVKYFRDLRRLFTNSFFIRRVFFLCLWAICIERLHFGDVDKHNIWNLNMGWWRLSSHYLFF